MNQFKKAHLQMKVLLFFLIKVYRFKLYFFDQLVNVFLFLASISLALGLNDYREKQIQKNANFQFTVRHCELSKKQSEYFRALFTVLLKYA